LSKSSFIISILTTKANKNKIENENKNKKQWELTLSADCMASTVLSALQVLKHLVLQAPYELGITTLFFSFYR
jgi:hypothetical protein